MTKYDLIVIGSGLGGYVTAIRASHLDLKRLSLALRGLSWLYPTVSHFTTSSTPATMVLR